MFFVFACGSVHVRLRLRRGKEGGREGVMQMLGWVSAIEQGREGGREGGRSKHTIND